MSHSLSPPRPSSRRRNSTHRNCDYGPDHLSLLAHNLAKEDWESKETTLRRRLSDKDQELVTYHNDLAESQKQLSHHRDLLQTNEQRISELEKEIDEHVKDYDSCYADYEKAVEDQTTNYHLAQKAKETIEELKLQITEISKERDQLRAPVQKRSRSPEVEELQRESKKLQRESKDARKRLTEIVGAGWKSDDLTELLELCQKNLNEARDSRNRNAAKVLALTVELKETRDRHAKVQQAFTPEPEADLSAITDLHPALSRAKNPTARQLADSLVEAITFDLNDIWSHLPHQQEEALVTPSTRRIDIILNRLKEAVKKDANLKLAPELAQAKEDLRQARSEVKQYKETLQRNTQEGVNQRIKPVLALFPGAGENLVITPQGVANRIQTLVQNATKAIIELAPAELRAQIPTVGPAVPNHFAAVQQTIRPLSKRYSDWQTLARTIGVNTPLEASNLITLLNAELQELRRRTPKDLPTLLTTDKALKEELRETKQLLSKVLDTLASLYP